MDVAQVQGARPRQLLLVHDRHKQIRMEHHQRSMKFRRRHADNRKRMLVHLNCTAHHSMIIMEMSVPVRIAENDIRSAVRPVLIGGVEDTPNMRLNLQCIEIVATDKFHPNPHWIGARVQPCRGNVIGCQIFKAAVSVAQINIVRI